MSIIGITEAIARIQEDIGHVESQIESVLEALRCDNVLQEAEILPILGNEEVTENRPDVNKCKKSGSFALSSKRTGKTGPGTETMTIDEDLSSNEAALPKGRQSESRANNSNFSFVQESLKSPHLQFIEEETFLRYVLDEWIFSSTVVNASNINHNIPTFSMSIVSDSGNVLQDNYSKSLMYKYKIRYLDEDDKQESIIEDLQALRIPQTLANRSTHQKCVRPGGKLLISASFSYPMVLTQDKQWSMLVTLLCDGKNLCSKALPFNLTQAVLVAAGGSQKYQERVYEAMSRHSQAIVLNQLSSRSSFYEFLTKCLGLNEVHSVQSTFDVRAHYFCGQRLNILFGFLAVIEECDRIDKNVRGLVFGRTVDQVRHFNQLLHTWLTKQNKNGSSNFLSRLPKDCEAFGSALLKEIKAMVQLVYVHDQLRKESAVRPRSHHGIHSPSLLKWLINYVKEMNVSDHRFVQ